MIGLVDTSGNLVVEYKYNAWGSILGTSTLTTAYSSLASMNPFRYRGYVYDEETCMYYCRARYYYPELQRWINVDALLGQTGQIFGHNLYCYCGNDPVIYTDPTGYDVEYYAVKDVQTIIDQYGYTPPQNTVYIDKVGKLTPSNHKDEGYYGIRYRIYKPGAYRYSLRPIEFHTHEHKNYIPHWQLNYWNIKTMTATGKKQWIWYLRRIH